MVSDEKLSTALHDANRASLHFNDVQRSEFRSIVNEHIMGNFRTSNFVGTSFRSGTSTIFDELRKQVWYLNTVDVQRLAPAALQLLFDSQLPSDCSFEERDLNGLLSVLDRFETRVGPQPADLLQEVDRIHSARSFPFMKLPAELRILVCELVISNQQKYIMIDSPCGCYKEGPAKTEPSITKVCRQLRHDSLPVFYASGSFRFHALRYDFSGLITHCEVIDSLWGVKKIRRVELSLRDVDINHSKVTIRCGEGLWDLFRWITTTNTDINFAVNRDGNFAPVNGAARLALECKANGTVDEGELRMVFDSWLRMLDLHCRCSSSVFFEEDNWYACSRYTPGRNKYTVCRNG
ncbi:hypothetical protein LTR10_002773 [Elasticomyces elasticus]|uniref:Uncharacterized protein n=1 Tax=Elasticomyces elasticus TaxID=574655 RepID=A0AAN8A130_9PEZI|nr:hypothetical protein LTR10_002773 [Elasticomyces elasticus]KAK4967887.1 hypothetical protein LTR42_010215 [Elasticomyces elasticus]KAK5699542.1 hypothetical protein LTR97_005670 [Elasticomyces elasticus]